MEKREIAQLVEKSRQGDNDAFGKLYQLTEKQAYFIALRIAKNEDDALDILQDCYIKAMQKMDTLENPENFVAWFNQIVSNTSKNYVVKSKPMLFRDDEDEAAVMDFQADDSLDAKPDDSLDTDETRAFIRELVDELPEDKRMCVLMFYFQNMGTAEIAKELGISEGTVKTRLYHSRDKIKQSIEALEKKGVKVRGIAPIPFFVWMLKRMAEGTQVSRGAAAGIIKAATASTATATTAAGATAATATAATTAATGAATAAGAAVATGITAKVVAIVAAGAVVIGGGAVGAKVVHDKRVEQATTAVAEESTEFASQNIAVAATENESGTEITVVFDGSTMIVSNENGTTVITVTPGSTAPGTTGKAGVTTTGGNTQPSTNAPTTAKETTTAKQTTTVKPTEKSTTAAATQGSNESDGVIISGSGGSGSSATNQTTTTEKTTTTTTTTITTQAPTTETTTVGTATVVVKINDLITGQEGISSHAINNVPAGTLLDKNYIWDYGEANGYSVINVIGENLGDLAEPGKTYIFIIEI